jgi:hypothetical protein
MPRIASRACAIATARNGVGAGERLADAGSRAVQQRDVKEEQLNEDHYAGLDQQWRIEASTKPVE